MNGGLKRNRMIILDRCWRKLALNHVRWLTFVSAVLKHGVEMCCCCCKCSPCWYVRLSFLQWGTSSPVLNDIGRSVWIHTKSITACSTSTCELTINRHNRPCFLVRLATLDVGLCVSKLCYLYADSLVEFRFSHRQYWYDIRLRTLAGLIGSYKYKVVYYWGDGIFEVPARGRLKWEPHVTSSVYLPVLFRNNIHSYTFLYLFHSNKLLTSIHQVGAN
jgi:hypothetical protein